MDLEPYLFHAGCVSNCPPEFPSRQKGHKDSRRNNWYDTIREVEVTDLSIHSFPGSNVAVARRLLTIQYRDEDFHSPRRPNDLFPTDVFFPGRSTGGSWTYTFDESLVG